MVIGASAPNITSYELIRILTRRFEIFNFSEVITQSVKKELIVRLDEPSREVGSYNLTEKGSVALKNIEKSIFEKKLVDFYPNQETFISALLRRI